MSASRRVFLALVGAGASGLGGGAAAASPGDLPLLTTYVAGSDRHAAPEVAGRLRPGDRVSLRREPGNGYDARSVAICALGGAVLGYVPRIHNQPLANLIDAGFAVEARVRQVGGPQWRPEIEIDVTLAS